MCAGVDVAGLEDAERRDQLLLGEGAAAALVGEGGEALDHRDRAAVVAVVRSPCPRSPAPPGGRRRSGPRWRRASWSSWARSARPVSTRVGEAALSRYSQIGLVNSACRPSSRTTSALTPTPWKAASNTCGEMPWASARLRKPSRQAVKLGGLRARGGARHRRGRSSRAAGWRRRSRRRSRASSSVATVILCKSCLRLDRIFPQMVAKAGSERKGLAARCGCQPAFFHTTVRPGPRAATAATPASKSMPGSGLERVEQAVGALGAERDGQPGAVLGGEHPGVRRGGRHVRAGDDLDPGDRRQVDEAAVARPEIGDARLVDHHHALAEACRRAAAPGGARRGAARGPRRRSASGRPRRAAARAGRSPARSARRRRASSAPQAIGSRHRRRRSASSGRTKLIASRRAPPARAPARRRRRCRRAARAGRASPAARRAGARSRRRLLRREAALRADQDRPGPGRGGGQRRGGRGGVAGLVAEHQPPRRVPGVEQRRRAGPARRCRAPRSRRTARPPRWHGRAAGRAQPLGVGVAGEDRQDAGGAELGRLLDDEVGARLLDRREDQPEVGRTALRPAGRAAGDGAAELAGRG